MTTDYHSKYYAHELTRRYSSDKLEKLSQTLCNVVAVVDLNPHQIEAALFAFRSPLSRGALLADEVGLGKTIEAGLVISQLWAEKKRRILLIVPASLREQWRRELIEKFFVDSIILEAGNYGQMVKQGIADPFEQSNKAVICSYHFIKAKGEEVQNIPWDLVVIDEAHRLRNVYRKDNKIAKAILEAIGERPKVLLTATPLQNSLMELYGLVRFIDPHIFGSEESFRVQYVRRINEMGAEAYNDLRERLQPICQRTLRRQVQEYISYTNRISITHDFTPSDEEVRLYEAVSTYLQKQDSYALPAGQRGLMTLVLRKILASSSFAISRTLDSLIYRLEAEHQKASDELAKVLEEEYDVLEEEREEWSTGSNGSSETEGQKNDEAKGGNLEHIAKAIKEEVAELKHYKNLAETITVNAKGEALLDALKSGFQKAGELGAPRKALIFTESRRTQSYLKELLSASGYAGSIVTLSGSNSDPDTVATYKRWQEKHKGEDVVTGSASVDIRTALVEEFKAAASIMIATESGAEGINLQFCNLVVNYDLPWNPQRIEQRIGRCHRYGQKHDVVVINFINRKNDADKRVFELLSEKFKLFNGVFGSSDEVLGALESGVDFEKRVNEIYQSCRTPEEINAAFDSLQAELEVEITAGLKDARVKLMEHFDEDVHARLKVSADKANTQVDRFSKWLWQLTKHELKGHADFNDEKRLFDLASLPPEADGNEIPTGRYSAVSHSGHPGAHQYRLGHPLATYLLERAKGRALPVVELVFNYRGYENKISLIEQLVGKSGWLQLSLLQIETLETEEELIFSGTTDDGEELDPESCAKLMMIPAEAAKTAEIPPEVQSLLSTAIESAKSNALGNVADRNKHYFESEMDKLEVWADDLKQGLERELKELDKEIRELRKQARQAATLEAKVEIVRKVKDLEKKQSEKRRNLFEAQDEVDRRKEGLLSAIEARLKQKISVSHLFAFRWKVE